MFAWVMATPLSARYVQKQSAEVFYKKAALENTVLKSFFNKFCKIFKNTYFEEHLLTDAFVCKYFAIFL